MHGLLNTPEIFSSIICFQNFSHSSYGTEKTEGFFGFGQHYSKWDLKGHKVPVIISEQGVGRGLQPLTFALNTLLHGVGSDWHTTYVAKPIYVTSRVRAFMLSNNQVSIFDLRNPERVKIELWATTMEGFIFAGKSPLELVRLITTETVSAEKNDHMYSYIYSN
jgi:hypothetical protein